MSTLWCYPSSISTAEHGVAPIQRALEDGFGEAVVACNMPKPCKFPSPDSSQKRCLWTHNEVDFAPHPVVGLVLQVEDSEKFPEALDFIRLDPFFRVSKSLSRFYSRRGEWR